MPKQSFDRRIDNPFSVTRRVSALPGTAGATINVGLTSLDVQGLIDASLVSHRAEADPHAVYLTQAEGDGRYSLLGHTHDDRYYTETESDALFVPVARTVTGTGALAGGGALSSNQAITMNTPGSLTATSVNSSAVTNHTHAIDSTIARSAINIGVSGLGLSGGGNLTVDRTITLASSSNPGAAAAILATSAGGTLTLNNGGSTTTPALVIGDGATGRLAIGSSGWRDNATQLEMLGSRTLYVGSNPVGGAAWSIDAAGQVSAAAGVDSIHTFGQARLSSPIGDSMMLSHVNSATNTGYGFRQTSPGATVINAASGQVIYTRIANVDVYTTTATGLNISSASNIGTDNYVSQLTGWRADYTGGADFRYLFADEMHVKSFIADLEQALAGGQIIGKSVAVLALNFTAPAAAGTATLRVKDLPSAANMAVFQSGDTVRLRKFSRSGGSLSVSDCWGVVTVYTDQADGTQTWTFTRSSAPNAGAMTAGTVVKADSLVLDYGVSGNGFYEVNAIDGAYAANSPYAQVAKWTTHPATGTVVTGRFGKLSGLSIGVANEFGIAVGSGFTTSDAYFKASNVGVTQNNVDSSWRTSGTTFIEINPSSGIDIYIPDDTPLYSRGYSFKNSGGTNISSLWAWYSTSDSSNRLELFAGYAARKNMINVIASSDSTHDADILLRASGRSQQADMSMVTSSGGSSVNFSGITSLFSVDAPQVNFSDATTFLINSSVTADTYLRLSSFTDTYIKSTYNATGTLRYIDISAGATSRVRLGNGNGFSLEADTNTVDVNGKLYSSGVVEVGQGRSTGNLSKFTGRNSTTSSISLTATLWSYGAAIGFNAYHANDSISPVASGAWKYLGSQYTGNVTRPGVQFFDGNSGVFAWYYGEAGLANEANVTTWTKVFEAGASGFKVTGNIGFNGTAAIAKPTVTGSRGGNAALASLLTALANYGLIVNSSTA